MGLIKQRTVGLFHTPNRRVAWRDQTGSAFPSELQDPSHQWLNPVTTCSERSQPACVLPLKHV
jgi:hypothetical protein